MAKHTSSLITSQSLFPVPGISQSLFWRGFGGNEVEWTGKRRHLYNRLEALIVGKACFSLLKGYISTAGLKRGNLVWQPWAPTTREVRSFCCVRGTLHCGKEEQEQQQGQGRAIRNTLVQRRTTFVPRSAQGQNYALQFISFKSDQIATTDSLLLFLFLLLLLLLLLLLPDMTSVVDWEFKINYLSIFLFLFLLFFCFFFFLFLFFIK